MKKHITLLHTSFDRFMIDGANQPRDQRSQSEDYVLVDFDTGSDETSAQRLVNTAYHRSQQTHLRAKQDDISAIIAKYWRYATAPGLL